MWPAATSTTMPSGSFRPSLMMVFKSEPSGFDVRTRPTARSKKYKRPAVFAAGFVAFALEFADDIELIPSFLIVPIHSSISSRLVHRGLRAAEQLKRA